jgi:hypothetical protein
MASLTNLLGGGSSGGSIDHRKEGLPLFGIWGDNSDQNHNVNYRIYDSGFKNVGSPWAAVCNSTTNYRFGMLGDASHSYNYSDHSTDVSHCNLTSQSYTSWTCYLKSMYQCDQYPWAQYYTSSKDGFISFHSYHQMTSSFEFTTAWSKLNMVLPEGIRPRRLFTNRQQTMRELNPGNNSSGQIQWYNYTSHMLLTTSAYATGTGYNEKNKMLVMVHSTNEGSSTTKVIHIFKSSVCLNQVDRIKDYFDNLTSTEYFTDTWTSNNNRNMTVAVGNNEWVGFGHKHGNGMRYAAYNCKNGTSLGTTGAARIYESWRDFNGSTTTSYSAENSAYLYTKFNTTWDGTWGMIYGAYYYYGVGICGWCMSLENPRKFISVNQTKSGRGNPFLAWGKTGFHGGYSDNTDSESWRTYAWTFDPTDSDHTAQTEVMYGADSGDTVVQDGNARGTGTLVTNRTGNYSLTQSRNFLHGGFSSTCYPMMCQVDWWGNYGNTDSCYGGKHGIDAAT